MRIHFTVEDLSRLRMVSSLGPVAESLFALDLFPRHGDAVFAGWRRQVRQRLGSRVDAAERFAQQHRPVPDLLWLLERPASGGPRGRADEQTATALFEFCQASIVPFWDRTRRHLESVRDTNARIVIATGVRGLLGGLHPRLRWTPPVLHVPGAEDVDIHLGGRGLLLSPSLFLAGNTCVVLDCERETGLPALVFAVPVDTAVTDELWGAGNQQEQALSALVGHTRAAALQALTESCTTGELSERLGISLAGASKHAKVLRQAGLVATARHRNTATHTLTPLGIALLRSREPVRCVREPAALAGLRSG